MNQHSRQAYLNALGIQCWQLKNAPEQPFVPESLPYKTQSRDTLAQPTPKTQINIDAIPDTLTEQTETTVSANDRAANSNITEQLQHKTDWPAASTSAAIKDVPVDASHEPNETITEPTLEQSTLEQSTIAEQSMPASSELDPQLLQSIQSCQLCAARRGRHHALAGQGNNNASVFIIGDAPNADEDRAGHYLTGQVQSLFQAMCNSIDLSSDYFLTGIIKCHSLENYLVAEDELNHCAKFLYAQLEQVNPKVLVVFGAAPAQAMLNTRDSFNSLWGRVHTVTLEQTQYPLIVTYHPAFLLRNPLYKKQAMADLLRIKAALV